MALSILKNESDASDAEDIAQEADPAGLATCLDDAGAYKQVLAAKLGIAHAFGVSPKIGFPGVPFFWVNLPFRNKLSVTGGDDQIQSVQIPGRMGYEIS